VFKPISAIDDPVISKKTQSGGYAMTDAEAWQRYPLQRWLYGRLQLSQALGYECGPAGTLPPRSGTWFVKPIINLNGMGVGAYAQYYDGGPIFPVRPGSFWMPHYTGRHLSIDLTRTSSGWDFDLTVECIYRNNRPYEWRKVDAPEVFDLSLINAADVISLNIELIGNHVIEVHLRRNYDFDAMPDASSIFPVWEGDPVPADMVADPEDADGFLVPRRLGFVYRQTTIDAAPPRVILGRTESASLQVSGCQPSSHDVL
jgi:hypothetical protein